MKGIIFVELLDFLESQFGMDVIDRVIDEADLPSGGAYTAVGTYSAAEALALVEGISRAVDAPVPVLMRAFGEHLFGRLAAGHPEFLAGVSTPLELLRHIEGHIHVEVLRLYPEAELPRFAYEAGEGSAENTLVMVYRSGRGLVDLCEGLIRGCCAHYGRGVEIVRTPVVGDSHEVAARFHITTTTTL